VFPLTIPAMLAASKINVRPILVFSFDNIAKKFGSASISERIRIGDANLYIDNYDGDPWYIGGLRPLINQGTYISFGGTSGKTTTRLSQQLQPDKGIGTSVTQLTISMIDKDELVTELISPGFEATELFGEPCRVELGFEGTSYPEDYITMFKGACENISSGAGYVTFSLSSTEQKKRQNLFTRATSQLATSIASSGSITTIDLDDASDFLVPVLGPDSTYDSSIKFYVQIGDEYFRYTGKTGNQLTGVTRNPAPFDFGQLAHDVGDDVNSIVRLEGNGLDLARKLMLSGRNGPYLENIDVTNFNYTDPINTIPNILFFFGVDVEQQYGIFAGDYITTTGATNGANNVTAKTIDSIFTTNDGSYVVVNGVTFVNEINTAAVVSFRSQWDTLGEGCAMASGDVDLFEFNKIYRLFLSSFDFDFRIKSVIEAKTFIEEQIFKPMTCFSIPRKGKSSLGYHIGPLPGAEILTLGRDNIVDASKLKIQRSISRNYSNAITYNYDKNIVDDKYLTTKLAIDSTSISDFKVGQRGLSFSNDGMRTSLQAELKALQASNRLLNRYKRAAEWFDNIQVLFGAGFNSEIGDVIIVNMAGLNVSNTKTGNRQGEDRLFQILNKEMDFATGDIRLSLTDTNFSTAARYGLISPASKVKSAASGTQFTLSPSYSSVYGGNEFLKWQRFGHILVRVRSPDGTTRNAVQRILSFSGNTVTLQSTLGFTPVAGDIMEFAHYNDASDQQKLPYAFMRTTAPFDDGKPRYQML